MSGEDRIATLRCAVDLVQQVNFHCGKVVSVERADGSVQIRFENGNFVLMNEDDFDAMTEETS